MPISDTEGSYGLITRCLHWSLTVLVALQLLLALAFTQWLTSGSGHSVALMLHESVGLTILVLGILFIIWRWRNPKPSLAELPVWQRGLAGLVHLLIYVAIVAQPIFGILTSFGFGFGVPFFGLFSVPVFIPVSEALGTILGTLHRVTGIYVIGMLLGVHIIAVIYHSAVRADGVFRRMWRGQPN